MSSQDEKIVQLQIDMKVLQSRMDNSDNSRLIRQEKEEETWKEVFKELRLIRQTQNQLQSEFPMKLSKCRSQVQDEMQEKYITLNTMKIMLRTTTVIGALAIGVIQGIIGYVIIADTKIPPKHTQIIGKGK